MVGCGGLVGCDVGGGGTEVFGGRDVAVGTRGRFVGREREVGKGVKVAMARGTVCEGMGVVDGWSKSGIALPGISWLPVVAAGTTARRVCRYARVAPDPAAPAAIAVWAPFS